MNHRFFQIQIIRFKSIQDSNVDSPCAHTVQSLRPYRTVPAPIPLRPIPLQIPIPLRFFRTRIVTVWVQLYCQRIFGHCVSIFFNCLIIFLLLDNFAGHKLAFSAFKNSNIEFSASNMTAFLQPEDQGFYQTVKERFKSYLRNYTHI